MTDYFSSTIVHLKKGDKLYKHPFFICGDEVIFISWKYNCSLS